VAQKTAFFMVTAVKTPNFTKLIIVQLLKIFPAFYGTQRAFCFKTLSVCDLPSMLESKFHAHKILQADAELVP
jgi:hypothetical protein